ncbi:MAG: DNA repair protein RecN [Deltaproteobacteria bacterium]|nr:DNA repair protein RecN [Deltaproteobacteria bacterium]MBW2344739.1 DNA repair protein RecN [Deltaproteobacteria bacterium]
MLIQLSISNFAIIKHLEITLGPGLNILSGETGAGKSIIINAMNLILGGRASADLIRSGCKEARVEALFTFPENPFLKEMLSGLGFTFDGELLIKRTIFHEGRNRIFINGSMATLQILSRLGAVLISISGQYENQLLLKPDNHLYVLDDFGGLSNERHKLEEVFGRYQSLEIGVRKLEKAISEISEKQDLTEFQIQEIERAEIAPGEDTALSEEKRRLQHAEELLEIVAAGYQSLYERHDSALSSMSRCIKRLEKGAEIAPALGSIRDSLAEIEVRLEDASFMLRDFQKTIHLDPLRLEEVADRLELLNRLKRKYGPTLEDIFRFREKLTSMMYNLDEKKEKLDQLVEERRAFEAEALDRARGLSKKRKKAAQVFEKAVEKELHLLHMKKTRFQAKFDREGGGPEEPAGEGIEHMGADGFDHVEFMMSPNVGEELRPLSKIASGGELSRIMLAVKTILARTASVETIIFDEVDSGISGATAEVVGEKLLSLAEYHQLLCITHLPQIATQGQVHFLVSKEVSGGRTHTTISKLAAEERVREIARLLGGREITPRAVAHAKEMLG